MNAFKQFKGVHEFDYHLHQQEFWNFLRATKNHQVLELVGGGLRGVWQSCFNNEQLVVLLIMMPVTRLFDSVKLTDVTTTFRNSCNGAGWLQWFTSNAR